MSEKTPEYLINSHGLQIHAGPSPLDYSACPDCGVERYWGASHDCAAHTAPGKEAEWTGRRPTYDELALAVLAYDRALHGASGNALGFDQRALYEAGDTLRNLARRLEPGP
jgi:hypothetical protein